MKPNLKFTAKNAPDATKRLSADAKTTLAYLQAQSSRLVRERTNITSSHSYDPEDPQAVRGITERSVLLSMLDQLAGQVRPYTLFRNAGNRPDGQILGEQQLEEGWEALDGFFGTKEATVRIKAAEDVVQGGDDFEWGSQLASDDSRNSGGFGVAEILNGWARWANDKAVDDVKSMDSQEGMTESSDEEFVEVPGVQVRDTGPPLTRDSKPLTLDNLGYWTRVTKNLPKQFPKREVGQWVPSPPSKVLSGPQEEWSSESPGSLWDNVKREQVLPKPVLKGTGRLSNVRPAKDAKSGVRKRGDRHTPLSSSTEEVPRHMTGGTILPPRRNDSSSDEVPLHMTRGTILPPRRKDSSSDEVPLHMTRGTILPPRRKDSSSDEVPPHMTRGTILPPKSNDSPSGDEMPLTMTRGQILPRIRHDSTSSSSSIAGYMTQGQILPPNPEFPSDSILSTGAFPTKRRGIPRTKQGAVDHFALDCGVADIEIVDIPAGKKAVMQGALCPEAPPTTERAPRPGQEEVFSGRYLHRIGEVDKPNDDHA
ncbi:hypothetical protein EDC01DRAFT_635869 [Geopyxis carbonaria]|nr:hypothetical protein EDC01DRAFT_635869 [Geopyxis carbonaria]